MNLVEIRNRKSAVQAVRDVVSAMRATAAGKIQAAQRAMAAAREYREVVMRGLDAVEPTALLPLTQARGGFRLIVVMMSEQPLCGGFNHAIVEYVLSISPETRFQLVVAGQRGGRMLANRKRIPDVIERGALSLGGLRELVRRLAARIDHSYASGSLAGVDVIYNRYVSVSETHPVLVRILPLDQPSAPCSEVSNAFARYLPDPQLVAGLVSQFAYISLYHAAAESFASQQANRLVAMDAATRNTTRMVDDLTGSERRERQHEITNQILELSTSRLVERPT